MSDYLDAAKKVLAKQVNSSRKDHVSEPISALSIGCLIYWRSMNGKLNGPALAYFRMVLRHGVGFVMNKLNILCCHLLLNTSNDDNKIRRVCACTGLRH